MHAGRRRIRFFYPYPPTGHFVIYIYRVLAIANDFQQEMTYGTDYNTKAYAVNHGLAVPDAPLSFQVSLVR